MIVQQMKRRGGKVRGSLNLCLRVRPLPNQARRRRRNQINGTRDGAIPFLLANVLISPRSHQEVKSNTPPLSGGGGEYISYCGTKNVVQRIENILVLVSHFHANPCCCNKTCRISHKIEWLKRSDNFYSLSDT